MSVTVRRGAPARRPAVKRKQKVPLGDRLLAGLPVSEAALRRAVTLALLVAGGAAAVAVASWTGAIAAAKGEMAEATARAGFRVDAVEITGLHRMDQMTVYAVALEDKRRGTPMLSVDLAGIRQRLLQYGWVKDAHVSRRLPDTLLVQIDERTPAAVWQNDGQLSLVDREGVTLEPVDPGHLPAGLPLLIGPGADRQAPALAALLGAAPALRGRVEAATWVGNRRWDLTFRSGETLALPEGDEAGAAALAGFAQMEASRRLLGRGWLRFDLRDPSKMYARRRPAQAGDAAAAAAKGEQHG